MSKTSNTRPLYRPEYSLLLGMIQGAIGKQYVIKHYGKNRVISNYPDMTNFKASELQKPCRNLFREAVAYAKTVIADPVQKAALQKKIRRTNGVYNEAIKRYMLKAKKEKEKALLEAERLIMKAFSARPIRFEARQSSPAKPYSVCRVGRATKPYRFRPWIPPALPAAPRN